MKALYRLADTYRLQPMELLEEEDRQACSTVDLRSLLELALLLRHRQLQLAE